MNFMTIYRQLNEDYFKDIEINDDDIDTDDTFDKTSKPLDISQYEYILDFHWFLKPGVLYKIEDSLKHVNVKKVYDTITFALEQTQLIENYYIDNPFISDGYGSFDTFQINENPLSTDFNLLTFYENKTYNYIRPEFSFRVYFNKESVIDKNMSYQRFLKEYMLLQNILKRIFSTGSCQAITMNLLSIDQTKESKTSSLTGGIGLFPAGFSRFAIRLYNQLFDNDAPEDDAYKDRIEYSKGVNYFANAIMKQTKFDEIIKKSAERITAQGKYKLTPQVIYVASPEKYIYVPTFGKKYLSYVCYDVESLSNDKQINQRQFEEDFIKNVIKCLPVQYISEIMLIMSFRPVNGTVFDIPEAKLKKDREGKVVLMKGSYLECNIENVEYGISSGANFYRKHSNKIRTAKFENMTDSDLNMLYTDRNGNVFRNPQDVNFYYMGTLEQFVKNILPNIYSKNISKKK